MVTMGPLRVAMNFIVSDQIDEILIGIDWLREHKCLLSFADLTITLQGLLSDAEESLFRHV